MPILALEGPDKSGKTTIFHELQSMRLRAKFMPSISPPPQLIPVMHLVEQRLHMVWRTLYDRSKLYIVDRHFTVSGPVYDALYGRQQMDVSAWYKEVTVVYFDVPVDVLEARHNHEGDDTFDASSYARAKKLYESVIRKFKYVRIDGTRPIADIAVEVKILAESLRSGV